MTITRDRFYEELAKLHVESDEYSTGYILRRIEYLLGVEFAPEPTPADDEPGTVRMSPDGPVVRQSGWIVTPWAHWYRYGDEVICKWLTNGEVSMDWPVVAQVPPATVDGGS